MPARGIRGRSRSLTVTLIGFFGFVVGAGVVLALASQPRGFAIGWLRMLPFGIVTFVVSLALLQRRDWARKSLLGVLILALIGVPIRGGFQATDFVVIGVLGLLIAKLLSRDVRAEFEGPVDD